MWFGRSPRGAQSAESSSSHRHDLRLLERTTGFEPATLTLAKAPN